MNANKFVQAVFYPLTEGNVAVALVVFWLLALLVGAAGLLGIWLAVVVVPAIFRYQVLLLEAQAAGKAPEPPGAEFFNWVDNTWTLFPVVIALATGWIAHSMYEAWGTGAMLAALAVLGGIYPAVLAILAITHSPLQSVNPAALFRFVRECGPSYAIAPAYLLVLAWLMPRTDVLWPLVRSFVEMFFVFSLHSVIGSVIQGKGIADDVYVDEGEEADAAEHQAEIEKNRIAVLGHAYGFISRDNRKGGFDHIIAAIGKDPEPAAAWGWYFNKMLGWEQQQHALFFAQHYISDALRHGEHAAALKVVMRCRAANPGFRPFREDIPVLVAAAEKGGNTELADVLKRG